MNRRKAFFLQLPRIQQVTLMAQNSRIFGQQSICASPRDSQKAFCKESFRISSPSEQERQGWSDTP
jgi:hypothetical protein